MSDENTSTTTDENAENAESTSQAEGTNEENASTEAPEGTENNGGSSEEDIPADVLRKELTKVRGEAANYRTKLREAEAALKAAKTPEEFEAATKALTEQVTTLERRVLISDVAQAHKLPPELADALKGDTKEELEAHAKVLAKFAPAPRVPDDLSGGLDPSGKKDDGDPVKAAMAAVQRRR